jgi:hypothetical protein
MSILKWCDSDRSQGKAFIFGRFYGHKTPKLALEKDPGIPEVASVVTFADHPENEVCFAIAPQHGHVARLADGVNLKDRGHASKKDCDCARQCQADAPPHGLHLNTGRRNIFLLRLVNGAVSDNRQKTALS